jgi:hypothetical protein
MLDCEAAHSLCVAIDLEIAGNGAVVVLECEGDTREFEYKPSAFFIPVSNSICDLFADGICVLPIDVQKSCQDA